MAEGLVFQRTLVDSVNRNKISSIYDFPYSDYKAQKDFIDELSHIQTELLTEGTVMLNTGIEVDLETLGGMLALNLHIDSLETTKESMVGLAKLGLSNERKLFSMR